MTVGQPELRAMSDCLTEAGRHLSAIEIEIRGMIETLSRMEGIASRFLAEMRSWREAADRDGEPA